jgi:hypothetical protein
MDMGVGTTFRMHGTEYRVVALEGAHWKCRSALGLDVLMKQEDVAKWVAESAGRTLEG